MQIDVDMSFEQYFEANQLFCLKTTRWRRFNYLFLAYVYPILGTVFAILAVQMAIVQHAISGALVQLAFSLFFFWCRFRYPVRVRKHYDQQAKNLPGTMTLTSEGMRFERKSGTANFDYTWAAFESWIDKPGMFLLMPGGTMFYRIPKDKLTSDEQAQVRGWLSSSKLLS
jgi:hypothetical protein